VAFSPDGRTAYVASNEEEHVSVISTATNTVTATIPIAPIPADEQPWAVAVSPDGRVVYVTNYFGNSVSVISTAAGTVTATVPAGTNPVAVAATDVPMGAPPPAPAVTAITPASGPQAGGTSVTIAGTGFFGATEVHFGSVPVTAFTVNSATQITATAPAAASTGTVHVTVTTLAGTSAPSSADRYTYRLYRADLSATLSCPAAITVGHHGTCTLVVANAGPDTAAVTASVLLPRALAPTACTPRCTGDNGTATWTLPALACGATATLAVTVRARTPGKVTILAEATTPTPDPDPYNNVATARVTINPPPPALTTP
jgi:YVTN family beta-propeller protein